MNKTAAILLFTVISLQASAQKYTTAAGIRIGTEFGVTVQQTLWNKYTLEAIAQKGFFNDLTTVSALFEQHNKIFFKGLNFYFGGGPHAGFYGTKRTSFKGGETYERKNAYGVTVIGGLELKLKNVLISYDYKPAINVTGGDRFFDSQTGLSVRYIFIKAKKKEQKWKFWEKSGSKKKGARSMQEDD